MTDASVRNAGYDDFIDALADSEGYYLECENGHGSLPPRRVCPHCGSRELVETALSEVGEIDSYTVVHVAAPSFADDAPYAVAVADFGGVRLTGQIQSDLDAVENGRTVAAHVGESETTGDRLLTFELR